MGLTFAKLVEASENLKYLLDIHCSRSTLMSPVANEKFQVLGELIPQPDYFWSLLLNFFIYQSGAEPTFSISLQEMQKMWWRAFAIFLLFLLPPWASPLRNLPFTRIPEKCKNALLLSKIYSTDRRCLRKWYSATDEENILKPNRAHSSSDDRCTEYALMYCTSLLTFTIHPL